MAMLIIGMFKYKDIKDCDGNLLYRKIIYIPDSRIDHGDKVVKDEPLVGKWKEDTGIDNILRRIDSNYPKGSTKRKLYKCKLCEYGGQGNYKLRRGIIKNHLETSHNIISHRFNPPQCHACKKQYDELYGAEKYIDWDYYKKRNHHWSKCEKVLERGSSRRPVEPLVDSNIIFDTNTLPIDVRDELLSHFNRKYINVKHSYSECQPEYIDTITTAYRSDMVKAIMSHYD